MKSERVTTLILIFTVLAVGASVVDARALPYAAGTAGMLTVLHLAMGGWRVRTGVTWGVLGLVLMMPVTVWVSVMPEKTVPQVYRLVTGIGLFYVLFHWLDRRERLRLAYAGVLLAGLALAFFGLFSVEWTFSKLPFIPTAVYERFLVVVADTVHPNVMAGSVVLLAPPALAGLLWGLGGGKGPVHRLNSWWFAGFTALVLAGTLVLTQSRGALLGLGAAGLLLIVLRWRRGWTAIPAGAAGLWWAGAQFGGRNLVGQVLGGGVLGGLDGRMEIWSRAVYMIQDFPFTGVGMGLFGEAADLIYPFFLIEPGRIEHAHQLFLQVGVDLGIPGLIAWLSIYFSVLYASWRVYREGRAGDDRWQAAMGAGLLASGTAMGVHGMVDAVVWGMVRPAPFVWALWGLSMAAYRVLVLRKA